MLSSYPGRPQELAEPERAVLEVRGAAVTPAGSGPAALPAPLRSGAQPRSRVQVQPQRDLTKPDATLRTQLGGVQAPKQRLAAIRLAGEFDALAEALADPVALVRQVWPAGALLFSRIHSAQAAAGRRPSFLPNPQCTGSGRLAAPGAGTQSCWPLTHHPPPSPPRAGVTRGGAQRGAAHAALRGGRHRRLPQRRWNQRWRLPSGGAVLAEGRQDQPP